MHSFLATSFSVLAGLTFLAARAGATDDWRTGSFDLQDTFIGNDFFNGFDWETFDDPTHGRVDYVDKGTAMKMGLAEARGDKFIMRADSNYVVNQNSRGRASNRITSQNTYEDSVVVLDVEHMPTGCATWPAFWTVTTGQWPNGGEIDIIEGVNTNTQNLFSLHTSPNCAMPPSRDQTGTPVSNDCNAYANSNAGCGTDINGGNSYGTGFNQAGGGWYVMKRTQSDGVCGYFWSRNDPSVPHEVSNGNARVNPSEWRTPDVRYPSTDSCDFASHFDAHSIVFDLTFCGDWAGNVYSQSGCGADMNACVAFVDNNPGAFSEAYWTVNSLRVYTPSSPLSDPNPDANSPPPSPSPASNAPPSPTQPDDEPPSQAPSPSSPPENGSGQSGSLFPGLSLSLPF